MIQLNHAVINQDPQTVKLLEDTADAIVDRVPSYTTAPFQPARSPVETSPTGAPSVIVGGRHAAVVSVEFGTRYRHASAPVRKAALTVGLRVPG